MAPNLIIACLSQKGGVGKSTLARLIARTYAAGGWRSKIADFNTKQKTSVDWAAIRMEANILPEVAAEAFTSLKSALRQDWDLMVFDGRPDSDSPSLDMAKEAALVVIPTSATLDDLKPQVLFAHELASRGIRKDKMLFVLNRVGRSEIAISDAKRYIVSGAGYQTAENVLPDLEVYRIAQNAGRAASETTHPGCNERADAIAGEIVRKANQLSGVAA